MPSVPMTRHAVPTRGREQMIDVTDVVRRAVSAAGVADGMAVVFVPHTTAAVTINENADPDVKHDLLAKLAQLVPHAETFYRHGEGNSDSHLKVAAVGSSVTVIVEGGRLQLGRWQGVQFCEFDGPRQRELWVKVVGVLTAAGAGACASVCTDRAGWARDVDVPAESPRRPWRASV